VKRRLYIPAEQLAVKPLQLTEEQARHLAVLRLEQDDELELFDGKGSRFIARIAGPRELRVIRELPPDAQPRLDVILVQALAKADKIELVIQKATELGVSRVIPLAAERAVVKLDSGRGASKRERWQKIAQEASRQSGRADVPRIDEPMSWDELYEMLQSDPERHALLLTPEEPLRLSEAARSSKSLLIAIGPEGGFSPAEIERAVAQGFVAVGLGPLVLRTETAGLAALAVVQHVHSQLG
jgi:16S rRNA (uracil1498-N3)-methyltransferase